MKYIVHSDGRYVIFSHLMAHSDTARALGMHPTNILGAGFVSFSGDTHGGTSDVDVICYGESISLGIKSRGEADANMISNQMQYAD